MRNLLCILSVLALLAAPICADDVYILIMQSTWQSIPTAKKVKAKQIFADHMPSNIPTPITITWDYADSTNNIWGCVYFGGNAWRLNNFTITELQKLKQELVGYPNAYAGRCAPNDFTNIVASKSLTNRVFTP